MTRAEIISAFSCDDLHAPLITLYACHMFLYYNDRDANIHPHARMPNLFNVLCIISVPLQR